MNVRHLALLSLPLLLGAPAEATVWPVSDWLTMQKTLDTAVYGDTVLVAPGTYKRVVLRSGIHLLAEKGPEETLLKHSTYWVVEGEAVDSLATIEGFTIDGNQTADGVVYAGDSYFTIRNCNIRGGWSGVRTQYSSLRIENCTIRECQKGMYLFESGGLISECDIQLCLTGIAVVSSNPRVIRTTITRNTFGIEIEKHADPEIGGSIATANRIWNNKAAVRNEAFVKEQGVRTWKPKTLLAPHNFWGSDCPDSALFLGPVEWTPWLDESGTRTLEKCSAKPAKK